LVTRGGAPFPSKKATVTVAKAAAGGCDSRGFMRVRVDRDRCQGHNRCYGLVPELFDVDDLGYATALNDGVVPTDLEERARLAVANCPEHAIEIWEDE
jgi:ferredoxin